MGAAALSTVTAVSIGISHGGGCSGVVVAELVLRVRRRTGRKGYDQGESRGPGENISQHNDLLAVMGPQSRRSAEHTSELQSLMRNSYAVFCFQKKKKNTL